MSLWFSIPTLPVSSQRGNQLQSPHVQSNRFPIQCCKPNNTIPPKRPQNHPKSNMVQPRLWQNQSLFKGLTPPTPTAAPCHLCKIVPPHLWWHWPPWHFCCSSGKAEGYPGGGAGQQIYIYIYIYIKIDDQQLMLSWMISNAVGCRWKVGSVFLFLSRKTVAIWLNENQEQLHRGWNQHEPTIYIHRFDQLTQQTLNNIYIYHINYKLSGKTYISIRMNMTKYTSVTLAAKTRF